MLPPYTTMDPKEDDFCGGRWEEGAGATVRAGGGAGDGGGRPPRDGDERGGGAAAHAAVAFVEFDVQLRASVSRLGPCSGLDWSLQLHHSIAMREW